MVGKFSAAIKKMFGLHRGFPSWLV